MKNIWSQKDNKIVQNLKIILIFTAIITLINTIVFSLLFSGWSSFLIILDDKTTSQEIQQQVRNSIVYYIVGLVFLLFVSIPLTIARYVFKVILIVEVGKKPEYKTHKTLLIIGLFISIIYLITLFIIYRDEKNSFNKIQTLSNKENNYKKDENLFLNKIESVETLKDEKDSQTQINEQQ
ncbi:hypothetical protein [Mycoplasma leonicaptivi]|uniref:hypothetical protein n=1 Tax=Mycoplasma leonicaptivi TaxID=36742 RepID=UPI000486D5F9|nr:hypothetical protein [Mycoplasma leonicaptivi]